MPAGKVKAIHSSVWVPCRDAADARDESAGLTGNAAGLHAVRCGVNGGSQPRSAHPRAAAWHEWYQRPSTHGAIVSRAACSCPHNARSCAHQHACTQQHPGSYACQQLGPSSHASSSRHEGAELASTSGASVSISATCQARARHGGTRQPAHAWWPCSFGITIQASTACEDRVPALFQCSSGSCSSGLQRQHATWQHHATQQHSPCGIACSTGSAATAAAGAAKGAGCFHGPARPHKGAPGRALPSQLGCAAGDRAGPHHLCGGAV